jgi:hypothetical protein
MEIFAAWPHSAPLPVKEAMQPILTLRPASLAASALCVDDATSTMTAAANAQMEFQSSLIVIALPKDRCTDNLKPSALQRDVNSGIAGMLAGTSDHYTSIV